jgi:MFS family permease
MVRGAMMSTIFVGVLCGGILGGSIGDTYGRRRAILLSYVGICVFGTATAAANGPIAMLILRFFFGASFGMGMGPGVAMQAETSPTSWRGHIINLGGLWFTIGEIYTAVLLILFMPDLTDPDGTHWRMVIVLSMIPGFVLFPCTYLLLQESPHFLLSNGRHKEACDSLEYIAYMNRADDKVEGLDGADPARRLALPAPNAQTSDQNDTAASASLLERSSSSSAREVQVQEEEVVDAHNFKPVSFTEAFKILFNSEYRSIILGGSYLCFLSNFLFYGLTYSLPQIFENLGKELSPSVQVLIISCCDLPGVLLAFFLIYCKTIGHRDGLAYMAAVASVLCLTLISIDHGEKGLYVGLPSAYLLKYVAAAYFTLAYVYLSEVFPSKVRSTGLSFCIAAGRTGSIFAPLIVESLHIKGLEIGEHAPFLMLTSCLCVLGIVVIKTCLHFELKNQPLAEDVQMTRRTSKGSESYDPSAPAPAG